MRQSCARLKGEGVSITNKLLKVQVEPAIELSIDIPKQTLSLENYGFDDVIQVLVDMACFSGSGRTQSGHFWEFKVLKARHKETRSIKSEVKGFAHNLRVMPAIHNHDPNVPNNAIIVF